MKHLRLLTLALVSALAISVLAGCTPPAEEASPSPAAPAATTE
jgi:hypothetical protein